MCGLGEERRRSARPIGAEVERQHEALAEGGAKLLPLFDEFQAFAADDQGRSERQPEGAVGDVGEPGVDPEIMARESAGEIAAQLEMIADAFDRIEIGDVEHRRSGKGDQRAGDGDRVVGGSERGFDRPVGGARAAAGMDHGAAFEVDHRE